MDMEFGWRAFPTVEVLRTEELRPVVTRKGRRLRKVKVEYLVSSRRGRTKVRQYTLSVAHTGLFKTFSDLSPSTEVMASFARRYGPLGLGEDLRARSSKLPPGNRTADRQSQAIEYREEVKRWKEAITEMGSMVALWEAIVSRNTRELKELISFDEQKQAIWFRSSPTPLTRKLGRPVIWSGRRFDVDPALSARHTPRDLIASASYILADFLNRKMKLYGDSPALFYERDCFRIRVVPINLIGAMWFQFASAVARRPKFGLCVKCGGYFEYRSAENRFGKRAGARYCSENCRVRASERRRPSTKGHDFNQPGNN